MAELIPTQPGKLSEALDEQRTELFAVVDGGYFQDLPKLLRRSRLIFRPLYLEASDADGISSGPFFVDLSDERHVPRLVELVGHVPAAVFWAWPDGGQSLYRHLRKLNMVEIPRAHGSEDLDQRDWEAVLFRHCDPNVMAGLLPLFDADQFAKVFGRARALIFDAPDYGGIHVTPRPDDLPMPPVGMLRITPEQEKALSERRLIASRWRIANYLAKQLPDDAGIAPKDLKPVVEISEKSGRELGIRTERGLARWAYLMMMSNGAAQDDVKATDFIRSGNPDRQVKLLIDDVIKHLREGSFALPRVGS